MIHIICHDFKSTSGNHAGMRHLYQEIAKRNAGVDLHVLNDKGVGVKYCNRIFSFWAALKVAIKYKKGDKYLFTEDIFKGSFHTWMISIVRFFRPKAPIYAMVHLTPAHISRDFSEQQLIEESKKVTSFITLGHSLTKFFNNIGIINVHTSFHYLDTDYYHIEGKRANDPIKVIVMGAMARDYSMLADVVRNTPNAHFVICKGRKKIDSLFEGLNNVTLLGFMSEEELRNQMALADVSLNVMEDTIGSNVICTSLGMGLAMLCSDVGSIRDYCDDTNTIFCNNAGDFADAINRLSNDKSLLASMQKSAIEVSKRLSIDNYVNDIWTLMGEK